MHEDIASALIVPLRNTLGRGSWVTRHREKDPHRRYSSLSGRRAVALISHERSGSSMLKSIFDGSTTTTYTGEVFNFYGNHRTYKYDFFSFCRDKDDWRRLTEPSEQNLDALMEGFFDFLLENATSDQVPNVLIDIKYQSACLLSGGRGGAWHYPSFVERLKRFEIPVVHLYRRNVFDAACSAHLAARSGLYNDCDYKGLDGARRETIPIERETLFQECVGLSAEIISWKRWLAHLHPVTLTYEELTHSDESRKAAVDRIGQVLIRGTGLTIAKPRMERVSRGPATYLANYFELQSLEQIFSDVDAYRERLGAI